MIVVVPVDPPRAALACPSLVRTTEVEQAVATALYEASVADVCRAVVRSGGDLLVNYRDKKTLPTDAGDPEAEVRALVADALESTEAVRFERQVGSTRSARIGNTVAHLLEQEGATAVGVLEPTAALVRRAEIDSAAMALRRHDVVLGPSTAGSVYFAGFTEPIDFSTAYEPPAMGSLTAGIDHAGLDLGFVPALPSIDSEAGLCGTITTLEARAVAGRPGGEATAAVIDDLGLGVDSDGDLECNR